jgi:hypothetical protein
MSICSWFILRKCIRHDPRVLFVEPKFHEQTCLQTKKHGENLFRIQSGRIREDAENHLTFIIKSQLIEPLRQHAMVMHFLLQRRYNWLAVAAVIVAAAITTGAVLVSQQNKKDKSSSDRSFDASSGSNFEDIAPLEPRAPSGSSFPSSIPSDIPSLARKTFPPSPLPTGGPTIMAPPSPLSSSSPTLTETFYLMGDIVSLDRGMTY